MILFSIEKPVSLNNYLWSNPRMPGVKILTKDAKDFRKRFVNDIKNQFPEHITMTGKLGYYAIYCPRNLGKCDIDNYATKAVLDNLTESKVWEDDSCVERICYEKGPVRNNFLGGKIYMCIYELDKAYHMFTNTDDFIEQITWDYLNKDRQNWEIETEKIRIEKSLTRKVKTKKITKI